ncbi:formate dehydrogenase [Desulfuribacillus alkaliarsenatis]|uniref:Formate dehydrogenase n=1 Tax=Desulfuribacillus alkaliarsenatis TaxID=766136 RepID=A0A1E5G254_9FIRM|nr:twin-arginine translocation signal domain-containing protein [Desulfuribacillus alkaliarsenatis]OEF97059.1 formate dehydrogenase [Desulfuribacillus alkaliarsenatis]
MKLSRRNLLKLAGVGSTAALVGNLGFKVSTAAAENFKLRTTTAREYPSVCCFCSGGCGVIAQVVDGKLAFVDGDPDNPSNKGTLCSKGAAVRQSHDNEQRVTQLLYRAPGSAKWEIRTWEWAINRIANLIKKTRDESFELTNDKGDIVSRTDAIASLGSSIIGNEDLYLVSKLMRCLGVTHIEHQARI